MPEAPAVPAIYEELGKIASEGAILTLPIHEGEEIIEESLYMYYSTVHWKPLVNGFSGWWPNDYWELVGRLRHFPTSRILRYLLERRAGSLRHHPLRPDPATATAPSRSRDVPLPRENAGAHSYRKRRRVRDRGRLMRLLYLADIRFPMERANGIQTIETCHALARRGVEVELAVRRSDARSDEACLAFYGLAPVKNLRLRRVLLPGRLGFLAYALTLLLRSDRRDVVYTRDLVLADLALKIADATIVYEAHTVAAVFAEERAQMYEGRDPPSATKLRRLDARERRVWRKASGTVAITAALLDALEKRHGEGTSSLVIADGCRSVDTIPPPITPITW